MTITFDGNFYALQILSQIFLQKYETRGKNCEKLNFGGLTPTYKTTEGVLREPLTFILL